MSFRFKLLFFSLGALALLFLFDTARAALNTVSRLDQIESERDLWQRPADIIQGLSVRPGDVVVDLGCGSGYFTLKLSQSVGANGRVIAGTSALSL